MSTRVAIQRREDALCWMARCPSCDELLYMVTDEAVVRGPRRQSGSSALLPIPMSLQHSCED